MCLCFVLKEIEKINLWIIFFLRRVLEMWVKSTKMRWKWQALYLPLNHQSVLSVEPSLYLNLGRRVQSRELVGSPKYGKTNTREEYKSQSYQVYQWFRLNFGKSSEKISFESLLTTFNLSNNFWHNSAITYIIGLSLKPNYPSQV